MKKSKASHDHLKSGFLRWCQSWADKAEASGKYACYTCCNLYGDGAPMELEFDVDMDVAEHPLKPFIKVELYDVTTFCVYRFTLDVPYHYLYAEIVNGDTPVTLCYLMAPASQNKLRSARRLTFSEGALLEEPETSPYELSVFKCLLDSLLTEMQAVPTQPFDFSSLAEYVGLRKEVCDRASKGQRDLYSLWKRIGKEWPYINS